MKFLCEVSHRGVTASHYLEDKKYMIWYYKEKHPYKTIGFVQVRGIDEPLTTDELKMHIDKLWDQYYHSRDCRNPNTQDPE